MLVIIECATDADEEGRFVIANVLLNRCGPWQKVSVCFLTFDNPHIYLRLVLGIDIQLHRSKDATNSPSRHALCLPSAALPRTLLHQRLHFVQYPQRLPELLRYLVAGEFEPEIVLVELISPCLTFGLHSGEHFADTPALVYL